MVDVALALDLDPEPDTTSRPFVKYRQTPTGSIVAVVHTARYISSVMRHPLWQLALQIP